MFSLYFSLYGFSPWSPLSLCKDGEAIAASPFFSDRVGRNRLLRNPEGTEAKASFSPLERGCDGQNLKTYSPLLLLIAISSLASCFTSALTSKVSISSAGNGRRRSTSRCQRQYPQQKRSGTYREAREYAAAGASHHVSDIQKSKDRPYMECSWDGMVPDQKQLEPARIPRRWPTEKQ